MGSTSHIEDSKKELVRDVHRLAHLGVRLVDTNDGKVLVQKGSKSSLVHDVKVKQDLYPKLVELKKLVVEKNIEAFSLKEDGVLRYQDRLCVSDIDGLREFILEEAHGSKYSIHPGSTKMYYGFKKSFLVARYEERYCYLCVKVPHLSTSEGRASKARWVVSRYRNLHLEVGRYKHGFCNRFAQG